MSLALPPPDRLEPERVRLLLDALGWPDPYVTDPVVSGVAAAMPQVRDEGLGGHWRDQWTWSVGPRTVTVYSRQRVHWSSMQCDCRDMKPCAHAAAVMIALLWARGERRELFEVEPWLARLAPLLETAILAPEEPRPEPPAGWIRYRLWRDERESDTPITLYRQILRWDRSGKRLLKPANAPESLEKLEEKVQLTDLDRDIARRWRHLREIRKLTRHSYDPGKVVGELVGSLYRDLFAALARCKDVVWDLEEVPLRIRHEPLRPRLRAIPSGDRLDLRWEPPPIALFAIGAGWALVDVPGEEGFELRPIAEDVPEAVRDAITRPLPSVPRSDVARFVDVVVVRAGLDVDLPDDAVGIEPTPEAPRPRLVLAEEEGGVLRVQAMVAYAAGGTEVAVPVGSGGVVRIGTVPYRRDVAREAALRAEAEAEGAADLRLTGDDALDFLAEKLPKLRERWEVFGEDKLLQHRYRGALVPRVTMSTGIDWFDLDVVFLAGDQQVAFADAIEGWRAGRRYLQLEDGTIARLPDRWLARNGAAAAEIEDLRGPARLRAHLAPLAEGLLAEAGVEARPWRDLAAHLAAFERIPHREVPEGVAATLRHYQHDGFRWLAFLRDHGLGGCLADDMGLGKTLQVLVLLADTHRERGAPSLVVAPTSVVGNWAREAARFVPGLRVHVHHGAGRHADWPDCDVIVTSYALMRLDAERLAGTRFRHVVLDEAQNIKNPHSQVAEAARALQADHRVALTGTPLENDLTELWSLYEFLMPGFFGTVRMFQARYGHAVQKERDPDAVARLRARLRPFLLRRLKSDVAHELPPRQVQVLACDLSSEERELYDRVRDTYRRSVLERVAELGVGRSAIQILEALTRLRQACCHPRLLPFPEAELVPRSSKVDALLEALEEASQGGHKSLVFSQWPSLLRLVAQELDERGITHLFLDGATRDRQALVDRFQSPEGPPVFLISIKAGGAGLNLTAADHVFHLDPWWNPAVEDQATDRAHRIGQTRPVLVHRLVATGTVEEKVLELQERKRALFQAAIEADGALVEQLTREDLEAVFAA